MMDSSGQSLKPRVDESTPLSLLVSGNGHPVMAYTRETRSQTRAGSVGKIGMRLSTDQAGWLKGTLG